MAAAPAWLRTSQTCCGGSRICYYEGPERVVSAAVLVSKDLDLSSLPQEMAQLQSEGVNRYVERVYMNIYLLKVQC